MTPEKVRKGEKKKLRRDEIEKEKPGKMIDLNRYSVEMAINIRMLKQSH